MATWDFQEKAGLEGGGWDLNEPNLSFNEVIDPDSGKEVLFNSLGKPSVWTNQNKS